MTAEELAQILTTYGAGLQAELALLHQLEGLSLNQRESSKVNDLERVTRVGDERVRLMSALVQIEHDLKPIRETIAANLSAMRGLPSFHEVLVRHRHAGELVQRIMDSDREVLRQLQDAEHARREAAHAIETGEITLAAYRRVLTPAVSSVGLVNRRG